MATTRLDFGAVLRRHRCARGLTQEALAKRARPGSRCNQRLERSRRRTPRPDTLALLADALELVDPERARLSSGLCHTALNASAYLARLTFVSLVARGR
jgi:transcriptional regulator with XRE-family HTH domain